MSILVTPQEVHDAKIQLDNEMVATNRQWESVTNGNAQNNPQFSPKAASDLFAWTAFFNSWNSFVLEDSSVLTAQSDLDRVKDYAAQLAQEQAKLQADANLSPDLPATVPTQSGGVLAHGAQDEANAIGTIISGVLKPIAWGAALLLVGWIVVETAPLVIEAVQARPRRANPRRRR